MTGAPEVRLSPNHPHVRISDCFSLQKKSKSRGEFLWRHKILEATLNTGDVRHVSRVVVDIQRSVPRNKAREGMKLEPIMPEYVDAYMDCVTGTLYHPETLSCFTSELLCIVEVRETETAAKELKAKKEPEFWSEQW